jgi:hypothetical protein
MAKTSTAGKAVILIGAAATVAGCATTQLEAQWVDPQLARGSLRGARVLVACEAPELVVQQMCQDQVAAEVVARGATAVPLPQATPPTREAYAQAAHNAGARVILVQRVFPYGTTVSPGLSFGIGGFGYGGGGGGVGVGVSGPVGGGQVTTGYAADTRLTDVGTGRVLWTAKASSPPSHDVQTQVQELARAVFASADKSGVF